MVAIAELVANKAHTRQSLITKEVLRNLKLTDHACLRCKQRFHKEEKDATNFVKSVLGSPTTKYMGISQCEKGNDGHMFTSANVEIILSMDLKETLTIINPRDKKYIVKMETEIPLYGKLVKIYEIELRKHKRKELSLMRQIEKLKMEHSVQIAELRLKQFKTKSEKIKTKCKESLDGIYKVTDNLEIELVNLQNEKRKIMRAMSVLVGQEFISRLNNDESIEIIESIEKIESVV